MIRNIFLLLLTCLLSACTGFFETDNTPEPTPLKPITATLQPKVLWRAQLSGSSNEAFIRQNPVIDHNTLYATNMAGYIAAYQVATGKKLWEVNTKHTLTSGVAAGNGVVVVGGRYGDILALAQQNGRILWHKRLLGSILAAPAISDNHVLIKTTSGDVYAFALLNGAQQWSYQQKEPDLILRAASKPLIANNNVYIGFANGELAKLVLNNGHLQWQQRIAIAQGAFGIERMIDIDADPLLYQSYLYAATYNGKIAALNPHSGDIRWQNNISSYTGMTADEQSVYITDAQSLIWSFAHADGSQHWQQVALKARLVTAPALQQNYLVVADAQGFLHWLNKSDGKLLARYYLNAPMYATPVVKDNVLYALTSAGSLYAITLG